MRQRLGPWLLAASLAALTGCNLIPPTGPSEINTRQGADGRVRQFVLGAQASGQLTLGKARKLLFAVSSGPYVSRAESFRIQADAVDPHTRFRDSSRQIAAEEAGKPRLRLQDIEPPPKKDDIRNFWINIGNSQLSGDRQQKARLVRATPHAYFFVDTESALQRDLPALNAQVEALADAFERTIYPSVTRTFGLPPEPGVDGDLPIYVVISPAVDNFGKDAGLMGYFWSRDLHARTNSNQKEIIFLTDQIFKQKPWTTFGTLAHEFTHLVVYNQKVLAPNRNVPEETWLDEAFAMLAMDLCGWGLRNGNEEIARDIERFQTSPEQFSLTDWGRNPKGFSYGLSYLFSRYLYDRYSESMIRDVLRSPQVGVSGVEQALGPRGAGFQEIFSDWAIATAISGMNLTTDKRYSFAPEINLRGKYGSVQLNGVLHRPVAGPADVTGPMRPWGTTYYLLEAPQDRTWTMDVRPGMGIFGGTVALP